MGARPSGVSVPSPSFVSLTNLLRVHSASSSRSLMKMLIRIRPRIAPWAPLLVIGLQVDFVPEHHQPLGPAVQTVINPPHCLLIQPISKNLSMRILWDSVFSDSLKVQVDNAHCSPLIYQASSFIIEVFKLVRHQVRNILNTELEMTKEEQICRKHLLNTSCKPVFYRYLRLCI